MATFDGVSVTTGPWTGLPAGWSTGNIGAVGVVGSTSYANGTFTVSGSGTDIWGTADQFRYAYRTLAGDGTITARVASVQHIHDWTKAGVMIRESLTDGAPHAFMFVSGANGLDYQHRLLSGGTTTHTDGGAGTAPRWVRLSRAGSSISAYRSTDGTSWTLVGTQAIGMTSTVYVGVAVTSHDNAATAVATFDNVVVE